MDDQAINGEKKLSDALFQLTKTARALGANLLAGYSGPSQSILPPPSTSQNQQGIRATAKLTAIGQIKLKTQIGPVAGQTKGT